MNSQDAIQSLNELEQALTEQRRMGVEHLLLRIDDAGTLKRLIALQRAIEAVGRARQHEESLDLSAKT